MHTNSLVKGSMSGKLNLCNHRENIHTLTSTHCVYRPQDSTGTVLGLHQGKIQTASILASIILVVLVEHEALYTFTEFGMVWLLDSLF